MTKMSWTFWPSQVSFFQQNLEQITFTRKIAVENS